MWSCMQQQFSQIISTYQSVSQNKEKDKGKENKKPVNHLLYSITFSHCAYKLYYTVKSCTKYAKCFNYLESLHIGPRGSKIMKEFFTRGSVRPPIQPETPEKTSLQLQKLVPILSYILWIPHALDMSSHVTAQRSSMLLQFIPHAHHLPWRLVVCCIIVVNAPKLAVFQAVHILHRPRAIELLYPHAHTNIFHLEQLHRNTIC